MIEEPLSPIATQQLKETIKPQEPFFSQPQTTTVKGALIGATITAFISWNSGRYSRIGTFLKRWKFIRSFVSVRPIQQSFLITNYHRPLLNIVANNFYCYSGQPGIGKSHHFNQLMAKQSLVRPSLYISFKSVGRQANYENDISQQLNYSEDGAGIISQIIRAIKRIQYINQHPNKFQMKFVLTNACFLGIYFLINYSSIAYPLVLFSASIASHLYYINFMIPILHQSVRRTIPAIVFDDLNKIEQMNMLSQMVRFLKLVQDQAVNIILVSSDQQTWSKLRRQPGMKDRLRVRQIKYDYIETANRISEALDKDHAAFKKQIVAHQIYDKLVIKALMRDLIAHKQMSIRRFISVMRLVDEEFYQIFIQLLNNNKKLAVPEVVQELIKVLMDYEAETMVSNLKIIKRQLSAMTTKDFLDSLQLLLKKKKLPQDNKIGSILKLYNVVRDLRSEYIINGRYTYIIYEVAVKKYLADISEFQLLGQKSKQQ